MGELMQQADVIAVAAFVALAVAGAVASQVMARRGERRAHLVRRLQTANQEFEIGLESDTEDELFREAARTSTGRLSDLLGRLDLQTALIGGVATVRRIALVALLVGVGAALAIWAQLGLGASWALAIGVGGAAAVVPVAVMGLLKRRLAAFVDRFPDAVDLVVRGLRAGLPATQALEMIAAEIEDPVGSEFRRIADQLKIGVSLDQALLEAVYRVRIPELRFFAVTLILQRETGGQLAEVLENLSDILRKRRVMKLKVKSLTSEARAAAKIVAALPFIAAGGMYLINEDHVRLLIDEPAGQDLLIYCAVSLVVGFTVIYRLMRIET